MKESIFSKKRILLLGSGELGKELVIESKRLGLEVIAIDRYEKAPAMQVADYSRVIDMGDKNILKNVIKEFKPDYVVPEIEALSIEALKELVIESKRLGLEVIAIDRYEKAPAMQVADYSRVIDMGAVSYTHLTLPTKQAV